MLTDSVSKEIYNIYTPYGLVAVVVKNGTTENLYYTETDHLGSIIGLINTDGSGDFSTFLNWFNRCKTSNRLNSK